MYKFIVDYTGPRPIAIEGERGEKLGHAMHILLLSGQCGS